MNRMQDPGAVQYLNDRMRSLTAEEKLRISVRLNAGARELKAAALRVFHPDWSEERIDNEVKMIFLYANT